MQPKLELSRLMNVSTIIFIKNVTLEQAQIISKKLDYAIVDVSPSLLDENEMSIVIRRVQTLTEKQVALTNLNTTVENLLEQTGIPKHQQQFDIPVFSCNQLSA